MTFRKMARDFSKNASRSGRRREGYFIVMRIYSKDFFLLKTFFRIVFMNEFIVLELLFFLGGHPPGARS